MKTGVASTEYVQLLVAVVGFVSALLFIYIKLRDKEKGEKDDAKIKAVKDAADKDVESLRDTVDKALEDFNAFRESIRETVADNRRELLDKVEKLGDRLGKFREDMHERYATQKDLERIEKEMQRGFRSLQEDTRELKDQMGDIDSISRESTKTLAQVESAVQTLVSMSEGRYGRKK